MDDEMTRQIVDHADRLREIEISLGRNGLVSRAVCEQRHVAMEARMTTVERMTASMSIRLWAILAAVVGTLVAALVP